MRLRWRKQPWSQDDDTAGRRFILFPSETQKPVDSSMKTVTMQSLNHCVTLSSCSSDDTLLQICDACASLMKRMQDEEIP